MHKTKLTQNNKLKNKSNANKNKRGGGGEKK